MNIQSLSRRGRALSLAAVLFPFPTKAQTTTATAQNKALVQEGFDKWAHGTGSFFDLLAEDVTWTVSGNSPFSRTYAGKKQFMEELILPLSTRLSSPIMPTIREIHADGDTVIVLWDGAAQAKMVKPIATPTPGS